MDNDWNNEPSDKRNKEPKGFGRGQGELLKMLAINFVVDTCKVLSIHVDISWLTCYDLFSIVMMFLPHIP